MATSYEVNRQKEKTPVSELDPAERAKTFDEVALGYTEEEAVAEARRCIQCPNTPCVSGCPVGVPIPRFVEQLSLIHIFGLLGFRHGRGVHAVVGVALIAVGVGHAGLHHVRGVVRVALQVTAHQVRKAREQAARGGRNAAAVVHVHGLVTVLVDGVLERIGDALVGLVPADLLELALAALAHALHGLHEAVGRVDPAADGAAAQAGTGLQPGGIAHVVRFGVDDLAVLHVPAQQARAAAVDDALAVDDLVSRRGAPVLGAFLALGSAAVQRASGGPGQREPGERALHERAARQRRCV